MTKKIAAFGATALLALSQAAYAATINTNLPGTAPVDTPEGFVANFYQFALMLGGLLAFAAIVYGALVYTVSAGNPEKQSDGKDRIVQALLGLALLMGAVVIINFINPKIITHPNEAAPFTLKAVDLEGLIANTKNTTPYDPTSPVNYATLNEQAKQARIDVQKLEAQAAQLRQEAADLEVAAETSDIPDEREEAKKKRAEADAIDRQLISRKAMAQSARYALSAEAAAAGGEFTSKEGTSNVELIQGLKSANDRQLDAAIGRAKQAKDDNAMRELQFEKLKKDMQFDAAATSRAISELPQQISATGVAVSGPAGLVYWGITKAKIAWSDVPETANATMKKIATDSAARANSLKTADPAKAAEIQADAKTAIDRIKSACAQRNLSCKDFK